MKKLFVVRLLLDFGLVVLIWMVQLIIYPSFLYYSDTELEVWHPIYTKAISLIVIPLMLGQLAMISYQIFKVRQFYTVVSFGCVLLVWLLTFWIFVPIHNKLSAGEIETFNLEALVNLNWYRTGIWSLIFLLNTMTIKSLITRQTQS